MNKTLLDGDGAYQGNVPTLIKFPEHMEYLDIKKILSYLDLYKYHEFSINAFCKDWRGFEYKNIVEKYMVEATAIEYLELIIKRGDFEWEQNADVIELIFGFSVRELYDRAFTIFNTRYKWLSDKELDDSFTELVYTHILKRIDLYGLPKKNYDKILYYYRSKMF